MHTVEFRIEREEFPAGVSSVVNPYVDGVRLQDLIRPVEQPFADREGKPDLAGAYAGLPGSTIPWPTRHLLGDPLLSWYDDGDTVLLGCECGDPGCWPLTAHVEVTDSSVTWYHFRTGHRDWNLSDLEPLVFDRTQYERALRAAEA